MATPDIAAQTRERFLEALRHHFQGWIAKAKRDFGERSYAEELSLLRSDPLYDQFGLAIPEYVFIRLMGRMSISFGRRLGEIYDKMPRFVAAARFGLSEEEATGVYGEEDLRLDMRIPYDKLSKPNKKHVLATVGKFLPKVKVTAGLGIEIRYNFNPNDSARLRKDAHFAALLLQDSLVPIYLIFSGISPRDEAIARLERAGWNFLIAEKASRFTTELTTMDLGAILKEPTVHDEVNREIGQIMSAIYDSPAFKAVAAHRRQGKVT
jgi:hypothetical protein